MEKPTGQLIDWEERFDEKFAPEESDKSGYEIKFAENTKHNSWNTSDARPAIKDFIRKEIAEAYKNGYAAARELGLALDKSHRETEKILSDYWERQIAEAIERTRDEDERVLKRKILELCWEIEKLPASDQQTKVVIMAGEIPKQVYGLQTDSK